jgi:hypothetical protein
MTYPTSSQEVDSQKKLRKTPRFPAQNFLPPIEIYIARHSAAAFSQKKQAALKSFSSKPAKANAMGKNVGYHEAKQNRNQNHANCARSSILNQAVVLLGLHMS